MSINQKELADAKEWAKAQENEFMSVDLYCGHWEEYENDNGESMILPAESIDPKLLDDENYGLSDHGTNGYLIRLSANGYLDCTDWSGPYKTMEDALIELYRIYGD